MMTLHAQQHCMIVLQVFFPLAPGIESIWEPFQEEVEERVQEVQRQIDEAMDGKLAHALACPFCTIEYKMQSGAVFHVFVMSLCILEFGNVADAVSAVSCWNCDLSNGGLTTTFLGTI
jgi:hypothetical protein